MIRVTGQPAGHHRSQTQGYSRPMLTEPLSEEHHHSVGFYADDDAFVTAVGPFLARGLSGDETVVVVATAAHRARVDQYLTAAGHDLADLRSRARYVTFDAQQTLDRFMVSGRPVHERFDSALGKMVISLTTRERPLRIYGEMVGVLWAEANVAGAIELEGLWNDLRHRAAFQLHCGYDVDGSGPEADLGALHRVCVAHTELTTPAWSGLEKRADDERTAVFLPSPYSLGGVRRFVRRTLSDWDLGEFVGDAELAVSELATNAVSHAVSPFEVSVRRSASSFTLQVRDTNPAQPEHREPSVTRSDGRGLGIISVLTEAWGVDADGRGKAVWARFDTGVH